MDDLDVSVSRLRREGKTKRGDGMGWRRVEEWERGDGRRGASLCSLQVFESRTALFRSRGE